MNWFRIREIKKTSWIPAMVFLMNNPNIAAQTSVATYPVVGQPIPTFRLTDVHYYPKEYFDPKEAQGKWLILDFWTLGCTGCVQSFPKLNQLQAAFKDQIQFLLIGINDKKYNKNIEQAFETYKKRLGLNLAIAYDSVLKGQFGVQAVPHVVIVDPEGKVYAVTSSISLTQDNLQALINHKKPVLWPLEVAPGALPTPRRNWKYEIISKKEIPDDLLYRSVLSVNKGEPFMGTELIDQTVSEGFFQTTRDLAGLYKFAWFGKPVWADHDGDTLYYRHYWKEPVLEVRDSSLFQHDYNTNTGFYNYSLVVPRQKATKEYLMKLMQSDLEKSFGFTAAIETRLMPYWKLTATETAKKRLKSNNNGEKEIELGPAVIHGKGLPVELLLHQIRRYYTAHIPVIDETGITGGIDIDLKAAFIDIEDVRKALLEHGLLLEKGIRPMNVLVVRDMRAVTMP